jgi:hypothetical protein
MVYILDWNWAGLISVLGFMQRLLGHRITDYRQTDLGVNGTAGVIGLQ